VFRWIDDAAWYFLSAMSSYISCVTSGKTHDSLLYFMRSQDPEGAAMSQDSTARDIFEQLDARLTRVEDDLRASRAEDMSRFDRVNDRLNARIDRIHGQTSDRISARFDQVHGQTNDPVIARINTSFDQFERLMFCLIIFTWITVLGSIWLKP
jgi:hypothetical protein